MRKNHWRLERRAFWQNHLREWQSSGLTKIEYCKQHALRVKSFYRWATVSKVSEKQDVPKTATTPPLIPITVIPDTESPPAATASSSARAGIRIHVHDKFVVELEVGFDAHSLERLWRTWT